MSIDRDELARACTVPDHSVKRLGVDGARWLRRAATASASSRASDWYRASLSIEGLSRWAGTRRPAATRLRTDRIQEKPTPPDSPTSYRERPLMSG